jgi:hypothetical protein
VRVPEFAAVEDPGAKIAVFEFSEVWCTPHRRHSRLGLLSPIEFERRYAAGHAAAA